MQDPKETPKQDPRNTRLFLEDKEHEDLVLEEYDDFEKDLNDFFEPQIEQ